MIRTAKMHVCTWYLLIDTLNDLMEKRKCFEENVQKTEFKLAAINASIIIHIAAIVEGSITSLLFNKLDNSQDYKNAKREDNHEVISLFEMLLSNLQKSTWNEIRQDLSKTILGYQLNDKIYPDFEAIKYLFEFRNLLAHGGSIIKEYRMTSKAKSVRELDSIEEEIKENLTKENMFRFLNKKNLVDFPNQENHISWKMINSKTSDFFSDQAKKFLLSVYDRFLITNSKNIFIGDDISQINSIR